MMRWKLGPWPSIAFAAIALLIGIYAIVGYRDLAKLTGDYGWVSRSHSILHEMDAVLMASFESETAARGYVLTGDEKFVPPYEAATRRSEDLLKNLERLTEDDPAQRVLLGRLRALVQSKSLAMSDLIGIRREQGFNVAQTALLQSQAPELMEAIQAVMDQMKAQELTRLERRAALTRATYETTLRAGAVMAVIALILLTLSYWLVWRSFSFGRKAAEALESRKEELEHAVQHRTAELQDFAHELERSNQELWQFAFVASHDLQEPLRKIQTFADRLAVKQGEALGEEGRDYLARMIAAATRMRNLIDALLAYSRTHTRDQRLAPVDLGETVREVLVDLELQIERTGGRVEVGELPTVEADPLQMRQLFQNLIGNALKFHRPETPPLVRISAEIIEPGAAPDAPATCRITVSDNGIGFDPSYAERIFDVFQRLHGRNEYEGSGIGLAISRRIAERHGGRIGAHGQLGSGASFIVVLPVSRPPEGS